MGTVCPDNSKKDGFVAVMASSTVRVVVDEEETAGLAIRVKVIGGGSEGSAALRVGGR